MNNTKISSKLVWLLSVALIITVNIMERGFGLLPCQICIWQRYPYYTIIVLIPIIFVIAKMLDNKEAFDKIAIIYYGLILTTLLIAITGLIGAWHAGIEWKLWPGLDTCGASVGKFSIDDINLSISGKLTEPSCGEAAWRLLGISLAGYNALIAIITTVTLIFVLKNNKLKS